MYNVIKLSFSPHCLNKILNKTEFTKFYVFYKNVHRICLCSLNSILDFHSLFPKLKGGIYFL